MTGYLDQAAPDERYMSPFEDAYTAARVSPELPAAALMQAARMPLAAGDPGWMGRYQLAARLGAGGMGVVYLGVAADGRLVAVKVLRPELADDPEFRARFEREAAVLARVKGSRVVRVIEAGTDSRAHFLVTEYAAGPSLARYVDAAGPLGAKMLHGLAVGLAEALTVIHAAGVVHRDLKPANVILVADGPKIIDFGIAQVLDSVSLTRVGTAIGSAGFMAPEQIEGHAGPPADIFAWAVTVTYAASGQPPFGTGSAGAVIYRIMNGEPSLAAVPPSLRPVVKAALATEPHRRPTAGEILARLTASSATPEPARVSNDALDTTVPIRAWPPAEAEAGKPGRYQVKHGESALLEPAAPGAWWPSTRQRPTSLRAALAVPALIVTGITALALALLMLRSPGTARIAADQGVSSPKQTPPAAAFGTYPGQRDRGVFQTISRIVASGNTIVTTGAQVSDGIARQQFFASADGGAIWRLASMRGPAGLAPAGYAATRLAGGPAGWLAIGPRAIWTSRTGLSWTLAATHGITPQQPGDQVYVLTATADGFVAAGQTTAPGHGTQAVIWTSRDGLTWQRMTAAQAGLATGGGDATSISYASWVGDATVISGTLPGDGWGTWLSTDGGARWTPVSVPSGHGAQNTIRGLGSGGSGLIAVRPGTADDAVAYFSPNGRTWQYAATIGAAGGFRPAVVKGSEHGFVVTGTDAAGDYLAYTSTGDGTTWGPTGSLGAAASYASAPAATVGPGGAVIAAGSTAATKTGQQAVVLGASTTGTVRPVPLAAIPGAVIPEMAVNALAVADGQQVAVGSADGYPAIWRKTAAGSWVLVSSLPLVSDVHGRSALTSVTHGPAGWLAVGTPGPVAYTSTDGITWQPAAGSITADLHGAVGVAAAADPHGYVIVGKLITAGGACVADIWWSPDLVTWTGAHDVNGVTGSSQVLAVAAGAKGFISAGSHNGQPAVWTTADGSNWTTMVLPLPSGATGVLQQIAISGNRVTALGVQTVAGVTTPLAELSVDGGWVWRQVPFGAPAPDVAVTALTADPGGFTAAVQTGTPGQSQLTIWTSAGGAAWTQARPSGLSGGGTHQLTALAPSGAGVTGIVSTATSQSQQPTVLTLPAR